MMSNFGNSKLITPKLIVSLRDNFQLDWSGIHGAAHWSRVRLNGLYLAEINGADKSVIEYFAFLHDSKRLEDGLDPEHGCRAAEYAKKYLRNDIALEDNKFDLLLEAMEGHTHGVMHDSITIATCWDADRLDLFRCGITPDPARLCTRDGKRQEVITAAVLRSQDWLDKYLID